MSNVPRSENVISQAAKLFEEEELKLPVQRVGFLMKKEGNSCKASQVLSSLKSDGGRYPFLS